MRKVIVLLAFLSLAPFCFAQRGGGGHAGGGYGGGRASVGYAGRGG